MSLCPSSQVRHTDLYQSRYLQYPLTRELGWGCFGTQCRLRSRVSRMGDQLRTVEVGNKDVKAVCLLGVEFVCPVFTNGVNVVSCRINRTAVRAARCLSDESVTFEQAFFNGTISPKCGVGSFDSSACIPVQKPSANRCWCNESDGNIFDYKFAYEATDTLDKGGRLECRVCLPLKEELDVNANENCRNMRFGSQDLQDGSHALITGCVVAILCVIILACTIFIARRHCFRQSSTRKTSGQAPEEGEPFQT